MIGSEFLKNAFYSIINEICETETIEDYEVNYFKFFF